MSDWFMNLDVASQIGVIVAGIGASGGIIVAIINGIFSVLPNKKNNKNSEYTVNQTAYDNAMQIGIQFRNKKEGE